MPNLKNQRGFTLIELLVTIALIGIIGVPLLGLLAASMQNNVHSRSRTSNGAVVQSFMELLKKSNNTVDLFSGNDTTSIYLLYKDGDTVSLALSDYPDSNGTFRYHIESSNNTDTYDSILNNFSDKDQGDFLIKAVLSKEKDLSTGSYTGMLVINVIVWDKLNKESSKTSLVSLRRY